MTDHIASVRRHWMGRALVAAAAITLLACADEPTGTAIDNGPRIGPTVAVTMSPQALSLVVGDARTFVARGVDAKNQTTGASFVWSSADPSIATVGQFDGSVVAVAPGSTTVTATAGTLSATGTVRVRPPDPPVALSILPNALSMLAGGADRLVARAVDSTDRVVAVSVEWASANPAIATVGRLDGMVTAIAPGITTITASTGTLNASVFVSVVDFSGSFAFTRTSSISGRFTSDVLIYSGPDKRLRSLPRPSEFTSIAGAAWSPNGTQLAVERIYTFSGPPNFEWIEYASDLYVVDDAASGTPAWRALTTDGLSRSPSWSPDGRRIAYVEQQKVSGDNRIVLIDAGGGTPVRLTRTDGYYGKPIWSPDGTRVAFSAWVSATDDSQILIVDVEGTRSTTITPVGTSDFDPSWSPDGTQLAFIRFQVEAGGQYHSAVVVSDVDGRNVTRITSPSDFVSSPAWSPDGRQIMFASGGGLYVMNPDGSAMRRITSPTQATFDGAPSWRR